MESLIEYTEMHGYPFATVWLSNLLLQDTLLTASIQLDKGRIIKFSNIEVREIYNYPKIILHNIPE